MQTLDTLGDYTIQKTLGEGVFGPVYLAEHRFLKRPFALKVLPEEISSHGAFLRRFEAEVAAIASLEHPHILKIHNISHAEGRYFLVTDPVVDSLQETMHFERFLQLKGKSLSEEEKDELLRQVASALDFAHERGLVHGSLKLTNILVAPSQNGVQLLLSDFGLVRLLGEGFFFKAICEKVAQALPSSFTSPAEKTAQESRHFLRSFAFLAPEQKSLEPAPLETAVDAYAFGVLTYFTWLQKVPEGCFELIAKQFPETKCHWDLLLHRCLQTNPLLRPSSLSQAMDECLARAKPAATEEMLHLSQLETALGNIHQMAFEFPRTENPAPEPLTAAFSSSEEKSPSSSLKPALKPQEIARPEFEPDPGAIFQRERLVSPYTPKKIEVREIDPLLTEMVVIAAGTYPRGSNDGARDELPRHAIKLESFALDIHPVTNEQFIRFLFAMGGEKDQNNNDIIRLRDARIKRSAGKLVIESGYGKHPVVGVTWYGAAAYAKWIGKRLPTEAEWEVAAAGGQENALYPTGSEIERSQANFFSSDTTPVMSYPSNPFGLYDMAGNVYEWCHDWYAYNYYDSSALEPDQPQGPHQGVYRVLRGGCWKSLKEDMRCSHRHRNNPGTVNGTYGFRCAADVV